MMIMMKNRFIYSALSDLGSGNNDKADFYVYAFMYCSDIHEGAWSTVSIHYTKEGAEKALSWHKEELRRTWESFYDKDELSKKEYPFGMHEAWVVQPFKVLQ